MNNRARWTRWRRVASWCFALPLALAWLPGCGATDGDCREANEHYKGCCSTSVEVSCSGTADFTFEGNDAAFIDCVRELSCEELRASGACQESLEIYSMCRN